MALPESLALMRSMPEYEGVVRHFFITMRMKEHGCYEHKPHEIDLNPHLEVMALVNKVREDVIAEGFECTNEDILLTWLTWRLSVT